MRVRSFILLSLIALGACGKTNGAATVTLYRNSSLDPNARVHFGTFDAADSDSTFNMSNCQMAARLLNANIRKLNDYRQPAGFWCEPGEFSEEGSHPASFDAAFPTDV